MTPSQTAELLGLIQAFDRRTVGEADIMAWHVTLAEVDFEHAKTAVLDHFGQSKDWLMPSDIKAAIAKKRERVIAGIPPVVPPWQLADLPEDENRWRANYIHAIADGLTEAPARTRANYLAGITDEQPHELEAGAPSLRESLDRAERERQDAVRMREIQAEVVRREKAEKRDEQRAAEAERHQPEEKTA